MNVYLRSGEVNDPPPDMGRTESDEDESYLNDADLAVDRLPQPYRTIDKIIISVFNKAWDEVLLREESRVERAKNRQTECVYAGDPLEALVDSSCVCFTPNSLFIIVSNFAGDLSVFETETHTLKCTLRANEGSSSGNCLESMRCVEIGTDNNYLLTCIDDMGFAKVFMYNNNKGAIFAIQTMNEQTEGMPKSNAIKFFADPQGDYCGLALTMDGKSWLDIYKVPKETWDKELAGGGKKKKQAEIDSDKTADSVTEIASVDIQLSSLQLMCHINQPSAQVTGNYYTSYKDVLDRGATTYGIGSGQSHLFTDIHLKLRRAAIKKLHAATVGNVAPEELPALEYVPTWHFLKECKLQPKSCVPQQPAGKSVAILTWWNHTYTTHMYPLIPPASGKEKEKNANKDAQPPEVTWPMCNLITSSAVSSSTVEVALAMVDGTVSVINRVDCRPLAAICVQHGADIRGLRFLDAQRLLVNVEAGGVSLIDFRTNKCQEFTPKLGNGDFEVVLLSQPSLASRFFVCATSVDRLQVYDVETRTPACDLVFQDSLEEASVRFWCAPDGRSIYARNDDSTVSCIHLTEVEMLKKFFPPPSESGDPLDTLFPSVVPYRDICATMPSFEEKMQQLLTRRTLAQPARTEVFKKRWFNIGKPSQTKSSSCC